MFSAVEVYAERLDDEEVAILRACANIIHQLVPEAELRYSFKVPFYHYYGMFCYLNKANGGIEVCFCRGKDLLMAYPQLELKKRKMIAGVTITTLKEIRTKELSQLIAGAALWQKEAKRKGVSFLSSKKSR